MMEIIEQGFDAVAEIDGVHIIFTSVEVLNYALGLSLPANMISPRGPESIQFHNTMRKFINSAVHKSADLESHAAALQASLEMHPQWNTPLVLSTIITHARNSSSPIIQALMETVVKGNPEAEKYLFDWHVSDFKAASEQIQVSSDQSLDLYAAFLLTGLENHSEWNTTNLFRSLNTYAVRNSSSAIVQKLFDFMVENNPTAAEILFKSQMQDFTHHAFEPAQDKYAEIIQTKLEEHPEWNTPDVAKDIIKFGRKSPSAILQKLIGTTCTNNPFAERFLFDQSVVDFANGLFYPSSSETLNANRLITAIENHPEWNTSEVTEPIRDRKMDSSSDAVKKLIAIVAQPRQLNVQTNSMEG